MRSEWASASMFVCLDQAKNGFPQILGPAGDGGLDRLAVILDAIEDEEWMANLLRWHSQGGSDGASDELDAQGELEAALPGGSD